MKPNEPERPLHVKEDFQLPSIAYDTRLDAGENGMVALRRTLSRFKCNSAAFLLHEMRGIVQDLRIPPEAHNGVVIEWVLTPSDYDGPGLRKSFRILSIAEGIEEDHWLITLSHTIRNPCTQTVRLKADHQEAIIRHLADFSGVNLYVDDRVTWSEEIKEIQKGWNT